MHQISLQEPGRFIAQTAEPPTPLANEAIVRVRRIGVCGTDLHAFAGRQPFFNYPRILGHELGVEVVSVPAGSHGFQPGDLACVEPYLTCGTCPTCRAGRYNCCESLQCLGVHCDGGMREFIAIPTSRLHKSKSLTLDQLALVETLGIGQHAVERARMQPGQKVLVVGAGPIGLATVQFAKLAGGTVTVLEPNPGRRVFAERFGAAGVADVGGILFDVVFDATGNKAAMEASFDKVAFGGTLVFVGLIRDRVSFDDPQFHRRELTILASRNSAGAFPAIIAAIEDGRLDTTPWITHRLGLLEVPEAFPGLPGSPRLIKAMIEA